MAKKNEVTLTFAGDAASLEKAIDKSNAATDRMSDSVEDATRKIKRSTRSIEESFDRTADGFGTADTRAMGFRDSITGVQDSVEGFSKLLKGDFSGEALLLAGTGIGDLASAGENLLVPALKNVRTGATKAAIKIGVMKKTADGAKLSMSGLAAAGGALGLALLGVTQFISDFNEAGDEGATGITRAEIAADKFIRRVSPVPALLDKVKEKAGISTEKIHLFGGANEEAAPKVRIAAEQIGISTEKMRLFGGANEEAAPKVRTAAEQIERQASALQTLHDKLLAQSDPMFNFIQAEKDLKTAQNNTTEAFDKFGRNSPEYEQALLDQAKAAINAEDAAIKLSNSGLDENLIPSLKGTFERGKITGNKLKDLKGLFDDARRSGESWATDYRANLIINGIGALQQANSALRLFSGLTGLPGLPFFHQGGIVPGLPGQETMAILQAGERVTSAARTRNEPISIEIHSGGSRMDDLLVQILAKAIRSRAGNVQTVLGGSR